MRRLILTGLVLLSMFVVGSPTKAQTLEEAKTAHVKAVLSTTEGKQIKYFIEKYAKQYKLEPTLVHAVILTESNYNKNAKSKCGAMGLGQLMSVTFKAKNVGNNPYDIEQNIHATAKHLGGLRDKYKGNTYMALAAYNRGSIRGSADNFNGKLPKEYVKYVNRVYYHKQIIENVGL